MSDVTLSAGVRANLLSLQNTADMMASTQNRLATGKAVNSALDNASNYFTAQSLNSRANDLNDLMDSIGTATKVLEAADNGIGAITELVESAQSTVRQAQSANDSANGTHIQGAGSIDTTNATDGGTHKKTVENQTLSQLGFDSTYNIEIVSTTDAGVTSEFDLQAHFASTDDSLADGDPSTTGNQAYSIGDLVEDINASGVATASITDDGRLDLQVDGNAQLELRLTGNDGANVSQGASGTISEQLGFGTNADVDGTGATTTGAGGTELTWTSGGTTTAADTLTLVNQATSTDANNDELVTQFNEIMDQIDELARDSGYNGINLINGTGNDLTVAFNEHRDENKSELTIASVDLSSSGLALTDSTTLGATEASDKLDVLSDALDTLRSQASTFGSNSATVTIREDFTEQMINTLQTGADDLVLADTNEEGANLMALQTRQSLSTTALSLASQADQAVLSFVR